MPVNMSDHCLAKHEVRINDHAHVFTCHELTLSNYPHKRHHGAAWFGDLWIQAEWSNEQQEVQ